MVAKSENWKQRRGSWKCLSEAERASGMEEQKATEIADTGDQAVERESEEPMVIEEATANRKISA